MPSFCTMQFLFLSSFVLSTFCLGSLNFPFVELIKDYPIFSYLKLTECKVSASSHIKYEVLRLETSFSTLFAHTHTPDEAGGNAGVNEGQERWEKTELPLAVFPLGCFMSRCERLPHPETHGHRTAGVKRHKAAFVLHLHKHPPSRNTTTARVAALSDMIT